MTVVADQVKAAIMKTQLESRGFLVIEVAMVPFAKAAPSIAV